MKKFFIVTLLTVIALVAAAQKNTVNLRLNLDKGTTYTQTVDANMAMTMMIRGSKIDVDIPMSMTISMKVVDIRDSIFVIETTYDAMKMLFGRGGFDSAYPNPDPDNVFAHTMALLIGKPFTIILDNRQNVLAVEGLDKIFSAVIDNEQFSEEQKETINTVLQNVWSEDKIRENFSAGTMIFPEEPIYKGFTWSVEETQNIIGIVLLQTKNTYTVTKITAANIVISSVSESGMTAEMPGSTTSITMNNAQSTGTYTIDRATGWAKSAKTKDTIEMVMSTTDEEKEITIPISIAIETTVK
jgi:hypothetical protein